MSTPYTPVNVWHGGAVTVPSDGDARAAASVSSPLEFLADNVTYVYNRVTGAYRIAAAPVLSQSPSSTSPTWSTANITTFTNIYGTTIMSLVAPTLVGDIVAFEFFTTLSIAVSAAIPYSAVAKAQDSQNGGAGADLPGLQSIPGMPASGGAGNLQMPYTVRGYRTITVAGTYSIQMFGATATNTTTAQFVNGVTASLWLLRPN